MVKLATDYLDMCVVGTQQATLVGMLWYIDGIEKTNPSADEVNEALTQRASIYVQYVNSAVVFSSHGTLRSITAEDIRRAGSQYHREFAAALKTQKK